jgi:hypothetical protein
MSEAEEYADFYGTRVALVVGDSGHGKSWYVLHDPDRASAFYLDLEDRYDELAEFHPWINDLAFSNCLRYTPAKDDDPIATWNAMNAEVTRCIREKTPLVVLDGISDLRRMAKEKWIADHGGKEPGPIPGAGSKNWATINDMVRRVLFRLFNAARINKTRVTCTVLWADEYKKNEATGRRIPDVKPWVIVRTSEVILVRRQVTEFEIRRTKSPRGPCGWESWNLADVDEATYAAGGDAE